MYQQNINTPDCKPSFIGLVTKLHDGVFSFNDMKKKCTKCLEVKLISEFSKHKAYRDGLVCECKLCSALKTKSYRRTKAGFITQIYAHQIEKSKHRGHQPPIYTKQQFLDFCFASPMFHKLFDKWKMSGFKKMLSPSFDRKDDYKGYSFDNFNRWMTWKENNAKGHADRKNGINNKHSKAVVGTHEITGKTIEFYSIHEAERQTRINHGSISKCCLGKVNHAGGYKWKHKPVQSRTAKNI